MTKPHFRLMNGQWSRAQRGSKPRLRLVAGCLTLVCPAPAPRWRDTQARAFIKSHYGTIKNFGRQWGLNPSMVARALPHCQYGQAGGQARELRLMLGLESTPTTLGMACALAAARRRQATGQEGKE